MKENLRFIRYSKMTKKQGASAGAIVGDILLGASYAKWELKRPVVSLLRELELRGIVEYRGGSYHRIDSKFWHRRESQA
jgi:hypothetical protein